MARLQLWNAGLKGEDYNFFDAEISELFEVGGTIMYVHKYLGSGAEGAVTDIQDVLFLENRDYRYDKEVYPVFGIYNVQDAEFDLRQFGLWLENDTLFISFHLNDMIAQVGRKIMPGDVLEIPHLRDDFLLNNNSPSINKFYLVEDASRSAEGYSPTWWPHVWRVKVKPLVSQQESAGIIGREQENPFGDLLDSSGSPYGTVGTNATGLQREREINERVVEAAKESVPERNFETKQFYVVTSQPDVTSQPGANGEWTEGGDEMCGQYPWVFAGDGEPPNGALPIGAGISFPQTPHEGDYFLRLDYEPNALFRFKQGIWRRQEYDYRRNDWAMAHRILLSFINNTATNRHDDGTVRPVKVALSRAVKPRADF